jgi:hypothetical protein
MDSCVILDYGRASTAVFGPRAATRSVADYAEHQIKQIKQEGGKMI